MDASSSPFRLDGKRALLVGAAQGIGASCATVFAELGATLCLSDVDIEQVERHLPQLARPEAHSAHFVDIADEASVDELIRDAVAALGQLDIVVCTAGVGLGFWGTVAWAIGIVLLAAYDGIKART